MLRITETEDDNIVFELNGKIVRVLRASARRDWPMLLASYFPEHASTVEIKVA